MPYALFRPKPVELAGLAKRFKPTSSSVWTHLAVSDIFKSRLSLIVRVNVVLNRTVVVDSE